MTKKIKHFFVSVSLVIVLMMGWLAAAVTPVHAAANSAVGNINAKAALAIDANTGQVLYQKNADQRLAVASMSKLLTVAVIEQQIDKGALKWSTKVKINEAEAKMSTNSNYSNVALQKGHSYTVRQLTEAALIKSGDAATVALSRAQGKDTAGFVEQMRATAKQIGISNYRFYNGVGLENGDMGTFKLKGVSNNAENEMTAKDVAKIAQYLIQKYPDVLQITEQGELNLDGKRYPNINEMLPGKAQAPQKIKVEGLKTGTSDKAGQCFAGVGNYKGHRIITVVMHANNRFIQTKQLYREIFTKYRPVDKQPAVTVDVIHGKKSQVKIATKRPVIIWQPNQATVQPQLKGNDKYHDKNGVRAPLNTKESVGQLKFNGLKTINNRTLSFKAYSTENVAKKGLLSWLGL